ncbi:hypothetical protein ACSAZL_12445 [Methanosarcina sp. T3]|uniref:hypothetical protein n=1 Tax=Methanosarcina sp. T3 TaxID=3439062 RepID=UPI003F860DAC
MIKLAEETDKSKQLRESIKAEKEAEQKKIMSLRKDLDDSDTTKYSPAVMRHQALLALANEQSDALYDVDPEQIPYISYLRAINEKIPIPATMALINSQLSLSRSINRKGRMEFAQTLIERPLFFPQQLPAGALPGLDYGERPGVLKRMVSKLRRKEDNGIPQQ